MKSKVAVRVKYWLQIFLLPIYWLSYITPRSKKIWVVGSTFGNRWADNGRYFYLYLSQYEKENVRAIWISRKKEIVALLNKNGREAYYVHSLKGIYYCLRAKVYVFDNYSKDISFWLSGGATKINLWHGAGNKKTNYDNKFDYLRHPRNFRERFSTALTRMSNEKPSHYILATSPAYKEIFMSAFQVDDRHIIMEGYPRNVMLLNEQLQNINSVKEEKNWNRLLEYKSNGYRLIIYMPTFRASEMKFFEVMDLEVFNDFLQREHLIFLTKMHPKSKVKEAFEKISYSNIVNVDADVDPYTFLREIDLMVTDYSSIYSDFLLLDRPSVIFPFDFEEYSKDTRESYVPYEEYIPEIKAYTMEELMKYIVQVLEKDTGSTGREKLKQRTFSCQDAQSSKRLFEKICKIIS